MKINIRDERDFFAGLIFVGFGLAAFLLARDYPMGTTVRMGPGYFPSLLGLLLTFAGAVLIGRSLVLQGPKVSRLALLPLVCVLGAVLAFGVLLERLGLVAATVALIFIACLAAWELFRLRDIVILIVVLLAFAVGLFVYGLGLPLKVWPW